MKKHRIKLYTERAGQAFRELKTIRRNEFDDILLDLDGNETIQFTIHHPEIKRRIKPEDVIAVAKGGPLMSLIKIETEPGCLWGDFRILPTKEPATSPTADEREKARLEAMASQTEKDAINRLQAAFPDMTTQTLHAGLLHQKGIHWDEMEQTIGVSRGTLSKLIRDYYETTGFQKADRRQGMGGKMYQLDEERDGGSV